MNLVTCQRCGAAKVRPSKSRSSDTLAGLFFLRPYRCGGCLTRFYAFRTFAPSVPITASIPAVDVPAAIGVPAPVRKNLFRIRVKVIVRLPWPTDWQSACQLLLAEEQGYLAMPSDHRSERSR